MRMRIMCMLLAVVLLTVSTKITVFATEIGNAVQEDIASETMDSEQQKIKIGDYIRLGNYNNTAILWRCVDIDGNGPLMFSDKILTMKPYDAAGGSTIGSHAVGNTNRHKRNSYGSGYWADSNIRDWLNSSETAGNVIFSCGNKPIDENVYGGYNDYANESGFLSEEHFTVKELEVIKEVTQKFMLNQVDLDKADGGNALHGEGFYFSNALQNYETAYYEEVSDKMFLLNIPQVIKVYENLGNYHIGYATPEAVKQSEREVDINSYQRYWLRDSMPEDTVPTHVRIVTGPEQIDYVWAYSDHPVGVRPAFYLDENAFSAVGGNGTPDSPYYVEDSGNSDVELSPRDEELIEKVKLYTSDGGEQYIKRFTELTIEIDSGNLTQEERLKKLNDFFVYRGFQDREEFISYCHDANNAKLAYDFLVQNDSFFAYQHQVFLQTDLKGTLARLSMAANGFVHNNELKQWIEPSTYITKETESIKNYKTMLLDIMNCKAEEKTLKGYTEDLTTAIKGAADVVDGVVVKEYTNAIKDATSFAEKRDIFIEFQMEVNKANNGKLKVNAKGFDNISKVMEIENDIITAASSSIDIMVDIIELETRLGVIYENKKFLQSVVDGSDYLPYGLVVAAEQLLVELDEQCLKPATKAVGEICDFITENMYDFSDQILGETLGGMVATVELGAWIVDGLTGIGDFIKEATYVEAYGYLGTYYSDMLKNAKDEFNRNPTLENAQHFYDVYNYLYDVRYKGEETYIKMSEAKGIVDILCNIGGWDYFGIADKKEFISKVHEYMKNYCYFGLENAAEIEAPVLYTQKIMVACPVDVEVYDENMQLVHRIEDGIESDISNTHGRFVCKYIPADGDYKKAIYLNNDSNYQIKLVAQNTGMVAYTASKLDENGVCITKGFEDVVIGQNSIITTQTNENAYMIDENGDGNIDIEAMHADKNKVFVQFDYQNSKQIEVVYVNGNSCLSELPTPEKEGYKFGGWFTELQGKGSSLNQNAIIEESMAVYAYWISEKVEVNDNSGSSPKVEKNGEIPLNNEIPIIENLPEKSKKYDTTNNVYSKDNMDSTNDIVNETIANIDEKEEKTEIASEEQIPEIQMNQDKKQIPDDNKKETRIYIIICIVVMLMSVGAFGYKRYKKIQEE